MTVTAIEPEFVVAKFEVTTAKSYHFHFKGSLAGWVIFTINDSTGELNVQSDWGDWAHRWGPQGLAGRTISQYIAEFLGPDYLCDKLHYGRARDEFDSEGTLKAVQKEILSKRRRREIDAELARELWEEADHICADEHSFGCQGSREMCEFLGEEWYYIQRRPVYSHQVLLNNLLPLLITTLREEQGLPPRSPKEA